MAATKIADFFAELGIKVNQRSLNTLEKNLAKIVGKLEKVESRGRAMSGILKGTSKAADAENKSIQAGNKVLAERQKQYEKLNKVYEKVRKTNSRTKINASNSIFADPNFAKIRSSRWVGAAGKNSKAWAGNFRNSVSGLTSGSKTMTAKARASQQAMYDKMFGALGSDSQMAEAQKLNNKMRAAAERLHSQAIREDNRRTKAAQNLARIQENVAKREQLMAARTAAIREAGAKRAAAIIEAGERRAQALANRVSGGSVGGRGGSIMGRATVGGALGAATSNLSGFIPGIGGGFAMMNLNRVSQEMQGQRLAMGAVTALPTNTQAQNDAAGNAQVQWVRNLANQVGFDYRATTPAYTRMLASGTSAGMSTGSVQNIFSGVSKYARVMGLSTDDTKGGMRAIEQMMN